VDSIVTPKIIQKENPMRKFIIPALAATLVLLSACNTVKGVGRDIESVGTAGERVIND
jgi:predicted small secreted protein